MEATGNTPASLARGNVTRELQFYLHECIRLASHWEGKPITYTGANRYPLHSTTSVVVGRTQFNALMPRLVSVRHRIAAILLVLPRKNNVFPCPQPQRSCPHPRVPDTSFVVKVRHAQLKTLRGCAVAV